MEFVIEVRAKPEKLHELYQALQALFPTIRLEKGCVDCRIFRDVEDGEIFFLSAHWKTQASLERYMRSDNGGALLGAIDLLCEKSGVRIGQDAPWVGIEILKSMRRNQLMERRSQ